MKCPDCGKEMCLEDVLNAGGGATIELFHCPKHKMYEVKTLSDGKRIITEYDK